ncbi:MAG: hypothetical protein K1X83_09800 [Oligoflexia bacterium]|nr:hypothetical protein [Oligoflexia bacterium]
MPLRRNKLLLRTLLRNVIVSLCACCLATFALCGSAAAQPETAYSGRGTLHWRGAPILTLLTAVPKQGQTAQRISQILIVTRVPGFGRFRGALYQQRTKNWASYLQQGSTLIPDRTLIALFRGHFTDRLRQSRPFSASIFESPQGVQISVLFNSQRRYGLRHYELSGLQIRGTQSFAVRVHKVPVHALRAQPRDMFAAQAVSGARAFDVAAALLKEAEVATKADYNWYQQYGAASNSRIASNINAAELLYETQLGLTFNIKRQVVIASPGQNYSATDPDALLEEFRQQSINSNDLGSADVYHLFTGRDLDDLYIGKAFIGTVCRMPAYSYGLSQAFNPAIDYLTFAHEVGHNLNALHDADDSSFVMSPAVAPSNTTFSDPSKAAIGAFVATYGSCLSSATPTPTATPTPQISPSATPAPGITPEPLPTSTPVPQPTSKSIGGGLTPGEDPDLPVVTLQATLNNRGEFSAEVTLVGGSTRSGCATHLVVARDQYFDRSAYLEIGSAEVRTIALATQLTNRISKLQNAKNNTKVPVKAVYLCPDINFSSGSQTVVLNASKIAGKELARSKWISRLLAKLRSIG